VRFEVLTAASVKIAVFWVVAPCSLVEATDVSEVLAASIIRATRCNNPEDSHIHWSSRLLSVSEIAWGYEIAQMASAERNSDSVAKEQDYNF
jgi:hypothetical protein